MEDFCLVSDIIDKKKEYHIWLTIINRDLFLLFFHAKIFHSKMNPAPEPISTEEKSRTKSFSHFPPNREKQPQCVVRIEKTKYLNLQNIPFQPNSGAKCFVLFNINSNNFFIRLKFHITWPCSSTCTSIFSKQQTKNFRTSPIFFHFQNFDLLCFVFYRKFRQLNRSVAFERKKIVLISNFKMKKKKKTFENCSFWRFVKLLLQFRVIYINIYIFFFINFSKQFFFCNLIMPIL